MICPEQFKKSIGIYAIICHGNGQIYIGSTITGFHDRLVKHLYGFRTNKHHSKYMKRCLQKYGMECFEFRVLEVVPKEECIDSQYILYIEQQWLDSFQPKFNSCKIAGNTSGVRHSQEIIDIITAKNKGRVQSVEERLRRKGLGLGRKASDESRAKMSLAQMGNKKSLGKKKSLEECEAISKRLCIYIYTIHHKDGRVFTTDNCHKFAKEHGFSSGHITRIIQGKLKSTKGFYNITRVLKSDAI